MTWMWKRALVIGALGLSAGGAVGCAEERPPINRVQANALAKSFFVGEDLSDRSDDPEFWTQGTLVDVGYGAAQDGLFTSTYAQPLSRIKWVITEDLLIGRITYERIDGSDGKGAGKATDDGVIAVAYPIISHFDIRRDYNPTTGEESNVIVENQSDRAWNQREYMRVDWSRNLNTDSYDFDTLSLLGVYGSINYESLSYYVNDENHEDAPHFDPESGYFDVTNKAFATPALIDLSHFGWGIDSFPACFLDNDFMGGSAPSGNCNPVEITIRQSFRRVVDQDYEPLNWDGYRFQAYGAFYVERSGYTRNYGMSDDKWYRFISRYNIWERSHAYGDAATMSDPVECYTSATTPIGCDPHRDGNGAPECYADGVVPAPDGTEDECASVGRGSTCDPFKQRCTLPYRDRVAKPVTWYYSRGGDSTYFDGTQWATQEWDIALRGAVMAARYSECQATGDAGCDDAYPMYKGQQDHNEDAVKLSTEVDDCRSGLAYAGEDCNALAQRLGDERGYDRGVIALAQMEELLVLCHSPVEAGDSVHCGPKRLPAGITAAACEAEYETERVTAKGNPDLLATCRSALNVRMGDLRYNQVNAIPTPQTPSPWGIYTDAEDPLTGEKVAASINIWTWVNDYWSQSVVDTMRYIKGELKTEDVTEGTYVRDWVGADNAASGGMILAGMNKAEIDSRLASSVGIDVKKMTDARANRAKMDPAVIAKVLEIKNMVSDVRSDALAPSVMAPIYEARRQRAQGTELEAELLTPTMQEINGMQGLPLSDEVMNRASPLRGGNPTIQREMRNLKEIALANRGACILQEAPAPMNFTGLADILEEKFGAFDPTQSKTEQAARAERMRKYIAQRAQYAVVIHEMGHSIAMRHNFVSSSDAYNYRGQYWQLRTKNGTVTDECDELVADGSACNGARYFDPVTDEESKNLIWMFSHSSVMDYAGEITQDMIGLGAYDFAATRMYYGNTVSVQAGEGFEATGDRGLGALAKMDSFGGILGFDPGIGSGGQITNFHYSQLNKNYDLISNCRDVDPAMYRPAAWNEERDGIWHPLMDGHIVNVDGKYSRCDQQKVDYVPWTQLRFPTEDELGGTFYRGGPGVDTKSGRVRVPYGFATDRWADTGNLSVYRHDNGADSYELFNFLIAQQEIGHIFDNYRRNRQSFSVRSASSRTLGRYNEKMRDAAKGLGLLYNIYKDFTVEIGYNFDDFWPAVGPDFFKENLITAGLGFDHFTRLMARPEPGPHYRPVGDTVLRHPDAGFSNPGTTRVVIPNGATGYYGNVGIGGKPMENALADDKGDYDSEYTINAGCYYDKAYTSMLFTESADNFISDSLTDFLDARYRAVSLADLFPDGYRRWLANNLTDDEEIKGPRLAADVSGNPLLDVGSTDPSPDAKLYPANAIGWTSWWSTNGPESCFPSDGSLICSSYSASTANPYNPLAPANVAVIDPQVGYEQQKFLIAWTLVYLLENNQQTWLDMMGMWEIGADSDPGFSNRIEFHNPLGKVYVAKDYGTEVIFGKTVQKGVSGRILEYANQLLVKAYETDPVDNNGDGITDWYIPRLTNGLPVVMWDPTIDAITPTGNVSPSGKAGCNASDNSLCTCAANRACTELSKYVQIPYFMRMALRDVGLADVTMKGIY